MTPRISLRRIGFGASLLRRRGFTLIELLTVMAIIVVLTGLVIGVVALAQNKAARARSETEIKALETALNAYQGDNGTYPRTTATDTLDARATTDPKDYTAVSLVLYRALSGTYYPDNGSYTLWKPGGGNAPPDPPKVYKTFKPAELNKGDATGVVSGNMPPASVTGVSDGFGLYYGYSTVYLAAQEAANASTTATTTPITKGYNPTFDIWSTGGYGTGGKSYPTDIPTAERSKLWITNWSQ